MSMTSELRDHALGVASALEPEVMTGDQAAAAIADLATAERAVSSTLMFTALRVARSDAWKGQGHATAADWLASVVGVSVHEASKLLGTAKKADRLPKTKAAMKKGDLSADQAGAVADGATADPDAEDDLLGSAANDTNKALKDKAARVKAAAEDTAARERRIRSRRSVRRRTDAEGAFWLRLYGPGVDAAAFEALFRPFEEFLFRQDRTDGIRDTYENRSYDAFLLMCTYLAYLTTRDAAGAGEDAGDDDAGDDDAGDDAVEEADDDVTTRDTTDPPTDPTAANGGEVASVPAGTPPRSPAPTGAGPPPPGGSQPPATGAAPPGGPPVWKPPWDPDRGVPLPTKLPGGNNVKVIVLVDHTALLRGRTLAGETCEIAGVGPISITAVREILATDPFLAVVVKKGRDVVNVAHHGRGLNAHQRTAIEAGGLRCTNRACNQTVALQIDHRVPYAADQVTELDNADPLCPRCHPQKTNHGCELEPGTGPRRFLPPDHPDHPHTSNRPKDATARDRYGIHATGSIESAWTQRIEHEDRGEPFPDRPPFQAEQPSLL